MMTNTTDDTIPPDTLDQVDALLADAFDPPPVVESVSDAGGGQGIFSQVLRATLRWPDKAPSSTGGRPDDGLGDDRPNSVVLKLPASGPNGQVALASGAYGREALAYTELLPRSPIAHPRAFLVDRAADGSASFVLEDLTGHRAVDQLDGLNSDDTLAIATALRPFHDYWEAQPDLDRLNVRGSVPTTVAHAALTDGLVAIEARWSDVLTDTQRAAFAALVAGHDDLAEAFTNASPLTLCHGDPRADNIRFDPDGEPVFFDWQQIALHPGVADLAWLAGTSLTPAERRRVEPALVAAYGASLDAYRLGFVLPGLMVLLLAQRSTDTARSTRFVATSLHRIGSAIDDLDLPSGAS